ncbi:hypothetical protein ASE67_05085 [Sphingomonas sp. Leaf23]|uniref:hypothetical protein n=1 Tax=Sphingomonas sp. Leaf23 TaxID=1735689 RepID=UPI0006F91BA6|nr:hypothetical protein [Sphingomonas sp. Leaf23]KQM87115.1 hypothetical protein ASE67_05085 [Sphingomonas sp. Leaf23]
MTYFEYAFVRHEFCRPIASHNIFSNVIAYTPEEMDIENPLFLRDHPMLITSTAASQMQPPKIVAVAAYLLDRGEHALIQPVAAHWNGRKIG